MAGSLEDDTANPIVTLEPNSMYITTQMLMAPGKSHVALLLTDEAGAATRHHWYSAHGTIGATETYISSLEHPARTYTPGNAVIFAYFQVRGYKLPENQQVLTDVFKTAFPETYKTLRESRQKGLTCKTWLLKVLATLQEMGIIVRQGPVGDIMPEIVEKTRECEQMVAEVDAYKSRIFIV